MLDFTIPKQTAARIPAYLRYLKRKEAEGKDFISSTEIAEDMQLSAVCVRKDLALFSSAPGKPKVGFSVSALIYDIGRILGFYEQRNAVIVGAGQLGRAILSYEGFVRYGITVIAAFDVSPAKIGGFNGKPIYPMERLSEIVRSEGVTLGVLTVPKHCAQEACNHMIAAGIQSILSFAPEHLTVPEGINIKYEDIASSLAALCGGLVLPE